MAEQSKEANFAADTIDYELNEDGSDESIKVGTAADKQSMWRMGKVQELRVSVDGILCHLIVFSDPGGIAQLPLRLDIRVLHDPHVELGDHPWVSHIERQGFDPCIGGSGTDRESGHLRSA
jgi:hypothetical protein